MTNYNKDDFRILFVYPNVMLQNMMPINLSLLSACLKEAGFNNVKLFDTTLYRTQEKSGDEIRAEFLQLRKWNMDEVGIQIKETDVYDDFEKVIDSYKPHLIAVTMTEVTYEIALRLLEKIKDLKIPTFAGGAYPSFSPEDVLANDCIDMVCVGEGEKSMVELCEKLSQGKDISDIPNIWLKSEKGIVKNKMRELVNLDELPFLDFTIYEEQRFYRPNRGKLFKTLPIEISRGCPYNCTFCCASSYRKMYDNNYLRFKDVSIVFDELKHQKEKYGLEFVYFTSESFLSMPEKKLREFMEKYKEIDLPFFFQTRPESITYDRLKILEGFDFRLSIGIESGNEKIRREVLNRKVSNETIKKATGILNDLDIKYGTNNMIGIPGETRDDIFDTINLNRECEAKDLNIFIFTPFRGTKLHTVCVEEGYIPADHITQEHSMMSSLKMPHISSEDLHGLLRTFPLYVKMPKDKWPLIKKAEKFDDEGNRIYEELSDVYREHYM
ncbi:radical SAM protein [Methanolobus sp. ZRKC5]|uniref:B12-binding domain-containing radical SAM protein n=1 Tax=unclassified Methanolobus TaxID=2629569 RepID=UPI00313CDCFA